MRWMMFCSAVWYCLILTTQREGTLIISGLCIEKGAGVVRMLKRVQEGGGGSSDKAWWRWANDSRGRWRELSPMTTQPEPASWSQREDGGQRREKRFRCVWTHVCSSVFFDRVGCWSDYSELLCRWVCFGLLADLLAGGLGLPSLV